MREIMPAITAGDTYPVLFRLCIIGKSSLIFHRGGREAMGQSSHWISRSHRGPIDPRAWSLAIVLYIRGSPEPRTQLVRLPI